MARIPLIDPRTASPEVQQIFEHRLKGRPLNFHQAMAHLPTALLPFLSFYAAVGKTLGPRLYELVYLRVSALNGCNYCGQHHRASSQRAGLTAEEANAAASGSLAGFSAAERTALEYAEKLTRTPGAIEDGDIAALRQHFSDVQVVDLQLTIGVANLTNRFTAPLGLEFEFSPKT